MVVDIKHLSVVTQAGVIYGHMIVTDLNVLLPYYFYLTVSFSCGYFPMVSLYIRVGGGFVIEPK